MIDCPPGDCRTGHAGTAADGLRPMPQELKPVPPPGSPAAIDAGCLCPVLDNGHGRGYMPGPTGPLYVYNEECPVHGTRTKAGQWAGPIPMPKEKMK